MRRHFILWTSLIALSLVVERQALGAEDPETTFNEWESIYHLEGVQPTTEDIDTLYYFTCIRRSNSEVMENVVATNWNRGGSENRHISFSLVSADQLGSPPDESLDVEIRKLKNIVNRKPEENERLKSLSKAYTEYYKDVLAKATKLFGSAPVAFLKAEFQSKSWVGKYLTGCTSFGCPAPWPIALRRVEEEARVSYYLQAGRVDRDVEDSWSKKYDMKYWFMCKSTYVFDKTLMNLY